MKKINYLISGIMILVTANAYCQTSYLLTFEGEEKDTSIKVNLDSVNIKNVTTGIDEMITDTSYLLDLTTGINDFAKNNLNVFSISQNYPNPSKGLSLFEVDLPTGCELKISAYNLSGQELSTYSKYFNTGIHSFSFEGRGGNLFLIVADNGQEKRSIKVLNINSTADYKSNFNYLGSSKKSLNPLKKLRGAVTFTPGDQLMLTGYAAGYNNDTIFDSPTGNKDYTFEFVGTITDVRDGHTYKIVRIGNQTWMAENLAYLPSVSPSADGSKTSFHYYVNGYQGTNVDSAKATGNYKTYGVLYNWPAAMNGDSSSNSNPSGVQGVCPAGWHIPSDTQWKELELYLGMSITEADKDDYRGTTEGGKLKEADTLHWILPNTGATNSSGFTALPGGLRSFIKFWNLNTNGFWWSSTEYSTNLVWIRELNTLFSGTKRSHWDNDAGRSVRCLRD